MDKLLVVLLGASTIGVIIWWFFGKHETQQAEADIVDNAQTVAITVNGGYSPQTVTLARNVPATLVFNRKDTSNCFSHVVFPDFGINEELPINTAHPIAIDTTTPGEYDYACGMNMFHGKIVIK